MVGIFYHYAQMTLQCIVLVIPYEFAYSKKIISQGLPKC